MRHLAQVVIEPDYLESFFKYGFPKDNTPINPIPADAQLRHVGVDPATGRIVMIFEHASFDPVPSRGRIPELAVAFRAISK